MTNCHKFTLGAVVDTQEIKHYYMTVKEAAEKFIENISVTDKQTEVIEGAFNNIESNLEKEEANLKVKEVFLNGSYVRDTIIRPLDDIDIFAVIEKSDYSESYEWPNPQSVLTKFKNYLNSLPDYEGKVSQSRPCVTIELSKLHIDVLPALRENGALYIPNEDLDGWMYTNPKTHTENLNRVDDFRDGKVKPIVKAVKSWKRNNGIVFPSFHVEEIACNIFSYKSIDDIDQAIYDWFNSASIYVVKDRFNTENQYNDALSAIDGVVEKLNSAREKSKQGESAAALKIWHDVFGSDFPTISDDEAKKMSSLLTSGNLKYAATTGLSSTVGHTVAASKGFYGEQ